MHDYDVLVIGAGSGGCASAMRSADLGKKVALVEARARGTGGTCVNRGCIPAKVLIESAHQLQNLREIERFGLKADNIRFDYAQIQKKKNQLITGLKFGLDNLLIKPRQIERLWGKAHFVDPHTLAVQEKDGEKTYTADHIIIATGSEPALIPAFNIDRDRIMTSDEALNLTEIPEDLIIIGAGALGLEFAYLFNAFGCRVTVVEMMPQPVPLLHDRDITELIVEELRQQNITLRCCEQIQDVKVAGGRVQCSLAGGETLEASRVLVAIGRSLNVAELNLAAAGVEQSARGLIQVNDQMQTAAGHIYAVGDVVSGPQLSHKAQREGIVAAENIAGMASTRNLDVMPWAVFMQPEIASVGMSVSDAAAAGIACISGKMPFMANEKAMCMQKTTGLVKLVVRESDHRIIGGHIFGTDASILIEEIALAMESGLTAEAVATSVHAHPTLSEIIMETAKNALGRSFHK